MKTDFRSDLVPTIQTGPRHFLASYMSSLLLRGHSSCGVFTANQDTFWNSLELPTNQCTNQFTCTPLIQILVFPNLPTDKLWPESAQIHAFNNISLKTRKHMLFGVYRKWMVSLFIDVCLGKLSKNKNMEGRYLKAVSPSIFHPPLKYCKQ